MTPRHTAGLQPRSGEEHSPWSSLTAPPARPQAQPYDFYLHVPLTHFPPQTLLSALFGLPSRSSPGAAHQTGPRSAEDRCARLAPGERRRQTGLQAPGAAWAPCTLRNISPTRQRLTLRRDTRLYTADLPQTFIGRNKGGATARSAAAPVTQPQGSRRTRCRPVPGRHRAAGPRTAPLRHPPGRGSRTPPHLQASPPRRSVGPGRAGPGAASSPAGGPGQPLPGPEDAAERGTLGRAATRKHRLRK